MDGRKGWNTLTVAVRCSVWLLPAHLAQWREPPLKRLAQPRERKLPPVSGALIIRNATR